MPFWDLQRQLGIDMDRWLLRQSATQPYGVAGACHAFEREWVECGHGLGQTRARRECQPEYEDFMECMHRTKLVSPAGRPGTGRGRRGARHGGTGSACGAPRRRRDPPAAIPEAPEAAVGAGGGGLPAASLRSLPTRPFCRSLAPCLCHPLCASPGSAVEKDPGAEGQDDQGGEVHPARAPQG